MSYRLYEYELPPLGDNDYGQTWPVGRRQGEGVSQITKELRGFRLNQSTDGFLSRYEHGLNLIRLLWPKAVKIFRRWKHYETGEEVIIWNHFFLRTFKALCTGRRTALTGCASSGKTFAVAVYAILLFMCDPQNTSVMVSTTAGTDAERRVWAEIKDLHNALSETYPLGYLIDYLKCITLDLGQELQGRKDVAERDLRNGIMLIPIPQGADGEKALGKVIGTKNRKVVWIIDEAPHMQDNTLRPESNLEFNVWFQLIIIGNANKKSDVHGMACEPAAGWESISSEMDEWEGLANTQVLFFHGERSPNFHPAVDPEETDKNKLPFPYLSNRISVNRVAEVNGRGNMKFGRSTLDFWRFAIGFWAGEDVSNTVLSAKMIQEYGANENDVVWSSKPTTMVAGGDFAFTANGDSNEIHVGEVGEDFRGRQRLKVDPETFTIRSTVTDKESYWTDVARQAVKYLKSRRVKPENFGMDTNADGGKMLQAIQREWKTHSVVALSSLEATENSDKYDNIVTQYWYQWADAVVTGCVRGFNTLSGYAKDLFARVYESVGKGKVKVEQKKIMKQRIKRSPDCGDASSYMVEMAKRAGFSLEWEVSPDNLERRAFLDARLRGQLTDRSEYVSHEEAVEDESEFEYAFSEN